MCVNMPHEPRKTDNEVLADFLVTAVFQQHNSWKRRHQLSFLVCITSSQDSNIGSPFDSDFTTVRFQIHCQCWLRKTIFFFCSRSLKLVIAVLRFPTHNYESCVFWTQLDFATANGLPRLSRVAFMPYFLFNKASQVTTVSCQGSNSNHLRLKGPHTLLRTF